MNQQIFATSDIVGLNPLVAILVVLAIIIALIWIIRR